MNIQDIHNSKTVRGIIIGLGIAILVLGIFKLGMVAGYHKARFSARFGDNFNRNFIDPRGKGFLKEFSDQQTPPGSHGAVGEIVSVALPIVIVADSDNLEKTVVVGNTTKVRKFRNTIKADELRVGDFVIILGTPNNEGQIEAKLIRLTPPPSDVPSDKKSVE